MDSRLLLFIIIIIGVLPKVDYNISFEHKWFKTLSCKLKNMLTSAWECLKMLSHEMFSQRNEYYFILQWKDVLNISFLRQYSSLWFEKIHFSEDVNNLFVHIKATYDFP